ncbi:unnamed protein product, partial [Mesorhabditis spiculigera]
MRYQAVVAIYGSDNEDTIDFGTRYDDVGAFNEYLGELDLTAPNNETIIDTINTLNGQAHFSEVITILFTASPQSYISRAGENEWKERTVGVAVEDVVFNFALPGGPLDIGYATDSLSSWAVQDVVVVLFTGSDPSKFPAAAQNYTRKSMTVGVAVGAQTSAFAAISVKAMQPATIYQAALSLCQPNNGFTTAQPSPTVNTGQYYSQISFADAVAAKLFSISKLNFQAGAAIYGSDNEGALDLGTLFDDSRSFSEYLTELDLTAPNDESIIEAIATMNNKGGFAQFITILFTASPQSEMSMSPDNKWKDLTVGLAIVLNFGLQGGQLDIGYATDMLSDWSVEDAVIVLFTGSDPHKFRDAGWNYTRRPTTIGVADGADTRAFAVLPVPYLHPIAIYDATIQLCRTAVPTRAPPTTTTILTTTPVDYRARCSVAFWLDASYEAWVSYEAQKQHTLAAAKQAFQKYDGGAFLFQASVWILGQGMGAPTLDTLETNFASFNQTLQGLDRLLKVTKADNSTIATTIGFMNSQPFYPHITLFFTNSNQAEIDASPENADRSSSYGYDFTPVNLMRLANSISDPPAAGMVDVIDNYCRKIHQD